MTKPAQITQADFGCCATIRSDGAHPDEIFAHDRALPARERLKLVERVLHDVADDPELDEAARDAELGRRVLAARQSASIPAEDVIAELRARR